jgi:hypothetical protein
MRSIFVKKRVLIVKWSMWGECDVRCDGGVTLMILIKFGERDVDGPEDVILPSQLLWVDENIQEPAGVRDHEGVYEWMATGEGIVRYGV